MKWSWRRRSDRAVEEQVLRIVEHTDQLAREDERHLIARALAEGDADRIALQLRTIDAAVRAYRTSKVVEG